MLPHYISAIPVWYPACCSAYVFESNSSQNLVIQYLITNLLKCINQCVHCYY